MRTTNCCSTSTQFPKELFRHVNSRWQKLQLLSYGCRLLPLIASLCKNSVIIFMGNERRHTLKILGRIFFFQWKFTSGKYMNVLLPLWNFSLNHECLFQSQSWLLSASSSSFAHVLLVPHGVFCFPNKTKIYGTQSSLTQLLQMGWLISEWSI